MTSVRKRNKRTRARPRKALPSRLVVLSLQAALVLAIALLWECAAVLGWIDPLYISSPLAIGQSLYNQIMRGDLLFHLGITLFETVIGFSVAASSGIVAGLLLYQLPLVNVTVRPILTAVNNLPRIALAPLFVLWFGLGSLSRIALVVSVVFFIAMLNTYAGLQNASRDHLLLAKTLGASRWQLFAKFVFPAAVPTIFAGLQLSLTYAFLTAVVGEMLTGSDGLGALLQITLSAFRTADFFAALLLLVIVATAISAAMRAAERYLLRWQQYELRGLQN